MNSQKEFDKIWETIIKPLKGTIVTTLDRGVPNLIIDVNNICLIRKSDESKQTNEKGENVPTTVSRQFFEEIYTILKEKKSITRHEINDIEKGKSSIVAANLCRIDGISFTTNPLTLHFNR